MERPKARPRNFFNTDPSPGKESDRGERDNNDNDITPEKRPRREHRDREHRTRTRSGGGGGGVRESTVENDSDLDAAELNRRIERLQRDLTRRDRELEDERLENEKAMDKIKKLERDKVELKREVEDFRLEAEEYKRTLDDYKAQMRSRSESYSPGGGSDATSDQNGNNQIGDHHRRRHKSSSKHYELIITQKNREISQLIEDVEKLDEDKTTLKDNLTELKENLEDATKQIEFMANEQFNLKSKLDNAEEQIRMLEEEKTVLEIKERDLMGFKERHEQYLDNLCKAVDVRVDIWKKMMQEKDNEINRLNSKVETLLSQIPNMQLDSEQATIRHLQSKLAEREDQISQLNDELAKATEEINSNIKLIEKLQSRLSATEDIEKTERMVKSLQSRVKKLEERLIKKEQQLKTVEKEAEIESTEHAALLAKIRSYESGEYGLSEAISEIKDLKVQIRIRDKQVETVTQEINILQMQVHDFEDENEMLRDKLGLEKSVDVSRETKRYLKNRKNEIIALRAKVNQLEDNIVQLKTLNYSMRKQIAQFELNQQGLPSDGQGLTLAERDRPDGGSVTSPKPVDKDASLNTLSFAVSFKAEDWKEKYEIILEENTALRKGLQEILDSMHKLTEEGTSEVLIQSPVLEDLLREMSARGIINYPYPITSFHLKVCNLEGKCTQLREELHRVRQEEKICRAELLEAKTTLKLYEEKLSGSHPMSVETGTREGALIKEKEVLAQADDNTCDSPGLDETASEELVSEKISREKKRLADLMEELKARILELEASRRKKLEQGQGAAIDYANVNEAGGRVSPTQSDLQETLLVMRDAIKLLEGKLLDMGEKMDLTNTGKDANENSESDNTSLVKNVKKPVVVHAEMQTEGDSQQETRQQSMEDVVEKYLKEKEELLKSLEEQKNRIRELQNNLSLKDQLISGFELVKASNPVVEHAAFSDLHEAIEVAQETINSLHERLKSKEESIGQYRKLLAEVRKEMTNASERHVQEMRQMQLTIHQQQQAFTRMKTTLSQPVKDTVTIEGTIKDQLTRIHELEDEVSELQHTLANVASQLTAARSDAHRWRCTAEMRLKEAEQAREHSVTTSMDEMQNLRKKLKDTQAKLEKAEEQVDANRSVQQRDSLSDLVSILRKELEEKDKQIGMYLKTLKSTTFNEKTHFEGLLSSKEREVDTLKEELSKHLKTISSLQLRLSKTKAVNYKTGVSTELEELRMKHRELQDEKIKLEKELHEFNSKRNEEESKKIKTAESVAKWEESKKWKKNRERLESKVKELELDNGKLEKIITALKASIHRLEKEKMVLDSRLKSSSRVFGSSMSKSSLDNMSETSAPSGSYHQNYILAQGEIAKLQLDLQDMKELAEKTEFEGREEIEKLKMEIRCLKERIVTQERQLTAYEVAQKGDPEVVKEIQKMAAQESQFQKEVARLEEENLHLRLQIEQLQLEAPRLRDRVLHLQKIVDALKTEKTIPGYKSSTFKSLPNKPLGELERTISALKQVIEKLQAENQRLKRSKSELTTIHPRVVTSERLKSSVTALMDEKRALLDRVQSLEQETEKYQRLYMEKCSVVDSFDNRLQDAEKRAKSSEMKLKAFLDDRKQSPQTVIPQAQLLLPGSSCSASTCQGYSMLTQKVQKLEEDILQKSKVLKTAKQTLKDVERFQGMVSGSSTLTPTHQPPSQPKPSSSKSGK